MSLSGDNRQAIIVQGILYPISMTLDINEEKIFWIDESRDTIETADYDGSNRRIIRRISGSLLYDIAVFKVNVFVRRISQLGTSIKSS